MLKKLGFILLMTHACIASIKCQFAPLTGNWQLRSMNDNKTYYNFFTDSVAIVDIKENLNRKEEFTRVKAVMIMFKNTSLEFSEDGFYKMYGSKMGEENGKFSMDTTFSILFFKKIIDLNLLDISYHYKLENNELTLYAMEHQYGKMIYTFLKQEAQ